MSTIIKARRVEFRAVPSEPHPVADAVAPEGSDPVPSDPDPHHEKSARLLQLDGEVVGVEFTCSCGETSVLEFHYGAREAMASGENALPPSEPQAPLPSTGGPGAAGPQADVHPPSIAPSTEEDPS